MCFGPTSAHPRLAGIDAAGISSQGVVMLNPTPHRSSVPHRFPNGPLPGLLAAVAFAGGCAEPQLLTSPGDAPAASASPAPVQAAVSSGGAVISRGTLATGFIVIDQERGLTTTIGVTFEDLGRLCAGVETLPAIAALFVERPTGAVKLLLKDKALPVLAWQLVSDDACGVLATTEPYAEGTAGLRQTDNDVSEFPVGPGGNASILRAVGKAVVLETGEALSYQVLSRTFLPRGATSFDDLRFEQSKIRLH